MGTKNMNVINFSEVPAVDMSPMYKAVLKKKELCAVQINIIPELPDDMKIIHMRTDFGYDQILLKLDSSEKMFERVLPEVEKIGSESLPSGNFMAFTQTEQKKSEAQKNDCEQFKSNGDVISSLQMRMLDISRILKINCPQFILDPNYYCDGVVECDKNEDVSLVILNLRRSRNKIFTLAHELRHAWQKKYHPELYSNYISLLECREKCKELSYYNSQIVEFDANVFAYAYCRLVLGFKESDEQIILFGARPETRAANKAATLMLKNWDILSNQVLLEEYKSVYPELIV